MKINFDAKYEDYKDWFCSTAQKIIENNIDKICEIAKNDVDDDIVNVEDISFKNNTIVITFQGGLLGVKVRNAVEQCVKGIWQNNDENWWENTMESCLTEGFGGDDNIDPAFLRKMRELDDTTSDSEFQHFITKQIIGYAAYVLILWATTRHDITYGVIDDYSLVVLKKIEKRTDIEQLHKTMEKIINEDNGSLYLENNEQIDTIHDFDKWLVDHGYVEMSMPSAEEIVAWAKAKGILTDDMIWQGVFDSHFN